MFYYKKNKKLPLNIVNLILYLLIVNILFSKSLLGQNIVYFVDKNPTIFEQKKQNKIKADSIILFYTRLISENDSLTLLGVSRKELLKDVSVMINNPNTTILNEYGYYCGIVAILNWMLNNVPDLYAKAVIELAYYGKTELNTNGKPIYLPEKLKKKINYSIYVSDGAKLRADIGLLSLSDFILGVSLVNNQKFIQKFGLLWKNSTFEKRNVGNFIFANTMPWEMDDYLRLIGGKDIVKSCYFLHRNKEKILINLTDAVNSGLMPILMENHIITADRAQNLFYRVFGAHFITIHDFKVDFNKNIILISYFDYGSVKNYRILSKKSNPLAAKHSRRAVKISSRINKIKIKDKYIAITIDDFFKGLKAYWIPKL